MVKNMPALVFSGTVALVGVILMLLARSCTLAQLGMRNYIHYGPNVYSHAVFDEQLAHPYIVTYITFLLIGAAILIVGLVGIIATLLRGEAK